MADIRQLCVRSVLVVESRLIGQWSVEPDNIRSFDDTCVGENFKLYLKTRQKRCQSKTREYLGN